MAGAEEHPRLSSRAACVQFPDSVREPLVDGRRRVVVLGATGWLGMVALELLESILGESFTRRVSAWASRARAVPLRSGNEVVIRDMRELGPGDVDGALVLHFAFLTRDRVSAMGADEFLRANRAITDRVLSVFGAAAPFGLVYTSSGAVYDPAGGFATDAPANPYGAAKRLDELAFQAACRDSRRELCDPSGVLRVGPVHDEAGAVRARRSRVAGASQPPIGDSGPASCVPVVRRTPRPPLGVHRRIVGRGARPRVRLRR